MAFMAIPLIQMDATPVTGAGFRIFSPAAKKVSEGPEIVSWLARSE
jgi:hypothetical protein